MSPSSSSCVSLADPQLERAAEHVDELDVGRERVELLAGAPARRDVRLGDVEAPLVARAEQQVLGVAHRQRAPRLLVAADQPARGDVVDQVADAEAEHGADPVERREGGRGEVALELADEAGGQAAPLGDLAHRQPALEPPRAQAGADPDLARLRQAHDRVSVGKSILVLLKSAACATDPLVILAAALVVAGGAAQRRRRRPRSERSRRRAPADGADPARSTPNPFHATPEAGVPGGGGRPRGARADPLAGPAARRADALQLNLLGERDGHSGIFPLDSSHRRVLHLFPLYLYKFSDGLFVVSAPGQRGAGRLEGARDRRHPGGRARAAGAPARAARQRGDARRPLHELHAHRRGAARARAASRAPARRAFTLQTARRRRRRR